MTKSGLLFLSISLSACTAKYDVVRHENNHLSTSDSYFVSNPKDGKYETNNYVNSGKMTRDAFYNELTRLGIKVGKDKNILGKEASLVNAKQKGFDVLIFLTILHWEDRATEWSGLRDSAKIKLELVDIETDSTIDNSVLDLVGTWWTLGGLHPQDMVNETVGEYFQQLFGLEE